ncbi:HigA family addiction module antitoxin [Stenotrophomonas sp. 22692]|uniref:XRE family transcriptional regulator n=1 Tax=Stenotrophomonas maltophilia TaxID=40324 RepID=A0AAW3S4C6_STEMA|nr:XRE family transcriptional regulator [Stenotrophomonas maltophilia]MBA0311815.1 XRE family transcriptional regulator [Stenotrophomonas maltophilia]
MEPRTPGQLVTALLKEKGWTKRTLAIVLAVDESVITRIAADKKPITADLALGLEELFHVPAERFLALQKDYDLALARIAFQPSPERAMRAEIFGSLPISEMIKRGWLNVENPRDVAAVEAEVARFFDVKAIPDIEFMPHAAKRTQVAATATPAQLAWIHRVKSIAAEMLVPKYTPTTGKAAIERLKPLLRSAEEARKVPRILAEAGIRFVVVETLPSAKIDGVCTWLADDAPVVGMSMRFDRIDNFWFVLRHELEHVLRGDGKHTPALDVEMDGRTDATVAEEERAANLAASAFMVPPEKLAGFIARKSPLFSERDIVGFSALLGVHPGLVAGQLQHATGKYDRFRSHLVKIRSIVVPGASTDGWGDVAPLGQ